MRLLLCMRIDNIKVHQVWQSKALLIPTDKVYTKADDALRKQWAVWDCPYLQYEKVTLSTPLLLKARWKLRVVLPRARCSQVGRLAREMLRWLSSRPTRGSHVKSAGGISLGCYRKLEIEPSAVACGVLRGMQGCLWGYDLRHPLFPARGAEIMGKVTEHPTVCATVSHCLKFLSLSSCERLYKTSGGECFYPLWETK